MLQPDPQLRCIRGATYRVHNASSLLLSRVTTIVPCYTLVLQLPVLLLAYISSADCILGSSEA
jgi:hypothetical protein